MRHPANLAPNGSPFGTVVGWLLRKVMYLVLFTALFGVYLHYNGTHLVVRTTKTQYSPHPEPTVRTVRLYPTYGDDATNARIDQELVKMYGLQPSSPMDESLRTVAAIRLHTKRQYGRMLNELRDDIYELYPPEGTPTLHLARIIQEATRKQVELRHPETTQYLGKTEKTSHPMVQRGLKEIAKKIMTGFMHQDFAKRLWAHTVAARDMGVLLRRIRALETHRELMARERRNEAHQAT